MSPAEGISGVVRLSRGFPFMAGGDCSSKDLRGQDGKWCVEGIGGAGGQLPF